jgi:PAS domain S-box-containing protein
MAAMDGGESELYVSPQIEELLGFSQKEWLNNPILWYTQLHPEDQARWHEEFANTCATGEPSQSIYRFIARDGRVVWVHGEAQMVRDASGMPLFLQGVAFDITGMKEAEEGLRALNATLEERVAERTAVAETMTRELLRSNEALRDYGRVVSHELLEPLRTMRSYIRHLAERCGAALDQQAAEYISGSMNAADRMRILIQHCLISRFEQPVESECSPQPRRVPGDEHQR